MGCKFPNSQPGQWVSTTKASFVPPYESHGDPTFRPSDRNTQTNKMLTKTSGYQQNRTEADGFGHKPNRILNPGTMGSEYRERFNPETSEYHRRVNHDNLPQLKKPE